MLGKFFFLALVALAVTEKVSYRDYKVYQTVPTTPEQLEALKKLNERFDYDFWSEPIAVNRDVRVMVSPSQLEEFLNYMAKYQIVPDLKIADVQKIMDAQMIPTDNSQRGAKFRNAGTFNWDRYHTIDEINAWLDELPELFPGIAETVSMGLSNDNRQIKGIIINYRPEITGNDRVIGMIEGGIHAREWISPATVTWIINEFLTSNDPGIRLMAENIEWHIFPVVNPDGYAYTFDINRMWRKNRNENHFTQCGPWNVVDDISNGIDLNRNFDFLWMTTGASQNPCSETYAGWTGFSEPESRAMANYVLMLKQRGNLMYYLSFHSYSQMLLVPFSHVQGADVLQAPNYADMFEIGIRAMDALEARHGTPYITGTSSEILYPTSGGSFDWVKGVAEVPIVFLYELRDTAEYGFLLPTNQIIPNNEEVMDSLVEMDRVARELNYYSDGSALTTSVMMLLAGLAVALRA